MALLVAERAVRDRRRGFAGWGIGIAGYVALMVSVYPAVHDSDLQRAVRSYPKELKAFFGGAGAFADLGVGAGRLAIASLGAALAAVFVGLAAMLAGAVTGSRAIAIGTGTVIFAASYLLVGLAGLVSWIEPFRILSPLYHANGTQPLRHGLPAANYAVLVTLCIATSIAAVVAFDRQDLTR